MWNIYLPHPFPGVDETEKVSWYRSDTKYKASIADTNTFIYTLYIYGRDAQLVNCICNVGRSYVCKQVWILSIFKSICLPLPFTHQPWKAFLLRLSDSMGCLLS